MKGTVGTKMMGNIENTNPEIISASQERRQTGSHVSKRKKVVKYHTSILLICKLRIECRNHAPFSVEFSS